MSWRVISWVLDESEAKLGARLVLFALAEYAHDDGTKAFPSLENIARKSRLSERGTRDALRKLEADGMIVCTGTTKFGTRIYTVVGPFNALANGGADSAGGTSRRKGGSSTHAGGQNPSGEMSQTAPDPLEVPPQDEPSVDKPSVAQARLRVQQAWLDTTGMVQHRESYFADDAIKRRIDKVTKKYGADDVIRAIKAYAEVLASDAHFFKHRWTFGDFLQRGLDRFVPEAKPLEVFLTQRKSMNGKQGLTADQIAQQAMEMTD